MNLWEGQYKCPFPWPDARSSSSRPPSPQRPRNILAKEALQTGSSKRPPASLNGLVYVGFISAFVWKKPLAKRWLTKDASFGFPSWSGCQTHFRCSGTLARKAARQPAHRGMRLAQSRGMGLHGLGDDHRTQQSAVDIHSASI